MLKLLRYLSPYRTAVATVLLLVLLQSLANLYLPNLMSGIVDTGVVRGDVGYIIRAGGLMLLVALGGAVCAVLGSYFAARTALGFGRDLREAVFTQVERFSLHEFDSLGAASLNTRTTNDITQVQQVVVIVLQMMAQAPLMAIGGLVMALSTDAHLSLVVAAVIPVLAFAILAVMRPAIKLFRQMQQRIDSLNRVLREGLLGVRVIRSFSRVDYERKRFDGANGDLMQTAVRVNQLMAFLMPTMMLVINLSTIAIVWFGGLRVAAGALQVGSLMAFLQYVMLILGAVIMLSMMFLFLPRSFASGARIAEVLETEPGIVDAKDAEELRQAGGIELRDVTFRYPGAEQPALAHVSFQAPAGEVTAIIGGTGAGKSTLLHLLLRFYDPQEGQVLVGGVDVRHLRQEALRQRLGFVPQQPVLFSGTIAENIRYGNPAASDEEVRHAAQVAQASEFILALPRGFSSEITQGGTNVSGGQKQRLAIARALVRKPEIYVFDDIFSALDLKTDAMLRSALRREVHRAAVLIVAQRVRSVIDADRIVVLDEGRVAGVGTHRELLAGCAVYREIVESQLRGEETA